MNQRRRQVGEEAEPIPGTGPLDALRVFRQALRFTFDEMFILFIANIICSLSLVLIVPFPPALGALWYLGNLTAREQSVRLSDLWHGFKRYFWRSWLLAIVNLIVYALLISNILFYRSNGEQTPFGLPGSVLVWIQAFWLATILFWSILQMYVFPLLLEQTQPRLWLAFRNTFALAGRHLGFTLVLALLAGALCAASYLFPAVWVFILPAFLSVLFNVAVRRLLAPIRAERAGGGEGPEGS